MLGMVSQTKRSTGSIALIAMCSANACGCHLRIVPAHAAAGKSKGIVRQTGKLPLSLHLSKGSCRWGTAHQGQLAAALHVELCCPV